jgi:hypothetical protein
MRRLGDAGDVTPFAKDGPKGLLGHRLASGADNEGHLADWPGFDRCFENVGDGDGHPLAGLLCRKPDDAVADMRKADANRVAAA